MKETAGPVTFLFFFTIAVILTGSLLSGCVDIGASDEETRRITDMLGREVDVPVNVRSTVGIEAGALRLLVYLNCSDRIAGVEEVEKDDGRPYTFAHPELQKLPSIGPIHGGDAELILSSDPDVIFWTYATVEDADELEERTGIPVVALEYGDLSTNIHTTFEALRLMGDVMGEKDRAEEIIGFIEERIDELDGMTREISQGEKPGCYVGGVSYRGAHGILSTEPAYAPLNFVNGDNVASELGAEHAFLDQEQLLMWDPEIIFVDLSGLSESRDQLRDGSYDSVDAVENGEVYSLLPYNWYTSNLGTVIANAYYIGSVLYPEVFSDIDPEEEADRIYSFMVGAPVYDDMEDHFGGYGTIDL